MENKYLRHISQNILHKLGLTVIISWINYMRIPRHKLINIICKFYGTQIYENKTLYLVYC